MRHQSRRGDLPGREEVWVGFQQLRSAAFHLPHSTTGPPWPTNRRANVVWSESEPGGTHIVCGGPCVGRFSHTKWATHACPLPGLQGDLGVSVHARCPLRGHTLRRYARCARSRKPLSAAHAATTHSCALPLLRPPASHVGLRRSCEGYTKRKRPAVRPPRRLTVRGVAAWRCGEVDRWICQPVLPTTCLRGVVGGRPTRISTVHVREVG